MGSIIKHWCTINFLMFMVDDRSGVGIIYVASHCIKHCTYNLRHYRQTVEPFKVEKDPKNSRQIHLYRISLWLYSLNQMSDWGSKFKLDLENRSFQRKQGPSSSCSGWKLGELSLLMMMNMIKSSRTTTDLVVSLFSDLLSDICLSNSKKHGNWSKNGWVNTSVQNKNRD